MCVCVRVTNKLLFTVIRVDGVEVGALTFLRVALSVRGGLSDLGFGLGFKRFRV